MKNLLIDTCVLIHIIRESSTGKKCLDEISKYDEQPNIIISVVTKAEMHSFAIQNNWGNNKVEKLKKYLSEFTIINIDSNDILLLNEYSTIDSYSKRKTVDKTGKLLDGSARIMGKNDLWIAATASALKITLLTTDGDFDHLENTFINLLKVS